MVGTNTLEVNETTMLAALNCYFATVYKLPMKAVAISQKANTGSVKCFIITATSTEPVKENERLLAAS